MRHPVPIVGIYALAGWARMERAPLFEMVEITT